MIKPIRPQRAGESRLLPDDIARRLIAGGEAKNPRDRFGNPLPLAAELPALLGRSVYKTKKATA